MADVELLRIGQIHLTVDDIGTSVAFYRDVLGMQLLFEVPEQSMAFFDCGGVRLYLGRAEGLEKPSSPLIYYVVEGIEETCGALERGGTEITAAPHIVHRTEAMELWMASVEDPDGHQVVLMEELAIASS